MSELFKPTQKMAANAKSGLELRAKSDRNGTEVGIRRAEQLAHRRELDAADVKSMHSYFARHVVDKDGNSHTLGSDDDPSADYIAWLLWGGDEGKAWSDRHAAELEERTGATARCSAAPWIMGLRCSSPARRHPERLSHRRPKGGDHDALLDGPNDVAQGLHFGQDRFRQPVALGMEAFSRQAYEAERHLVDGLPLNERQQDIENGSRFGRKGG